MRFISIRWWLPLAFTLIAAGTAAGVGLVLNQRAEDAFHARTHQLAVGDAVDAGNQLRRFGASPDTMSAVAAKQNLALFVVDFHGSPLTRATSSGVALANVPSVDAAVSAVSHLRRYVRGTANGGTVVGLRMPTMNAVLIAYRPRSSAAAEAAVVRRELVPSALIAGAAGALVGVLVATLFTRRVRRISETADAIRRGNFNKSLEPRFPDEIGSLGRAIDEMRTQLDASFRALAFERDRLRTILERLHDGVIAVDLDNRVEFANPTAQRFAADLQFQPGEQIVEPWPDIDLRAVVAEVRGSDAPVEHRFRHGGRTFDLVGLAAMRRQNTVILVLTDVSERERRERAEREFVQNAAHELRTPTAAIISSIESINNGGREDAEVLDRFLGHIDREAARLARLTAAMLTLARAQTNTEPIVMRPVSVPAALNEAIDGLGATGLRLHLSSDEDLWVAADPDLTYHLFHNLLSNAAKHGGSCVRVDSRRNGKGTIITVRDDGPGVPSEQQDRIFDRFYRANGRRDSNGFGLGLAIVREVVSALRGEVKVASGSSGTTVVVVLQSWEEQA